MKHTNHLLKLPLQAHASLPEVNFTVANGAYFQISVHDMNLILFALAVSSLP